MSGSDSQETLVFSDAEVDEQVENLTWEDSKHFTLPFGKYKGKSLQAMIVSGKRRHYLRYLQKWDELMPATRAHLENALKEYDRLKAEAAGPPKKKAKKTK